MASRPFLFNSSRFIVTPSGNWSVFAIGVGTPPQNFSMFVSTVDDESIVLPFSVDGESTQSQDSFNSSESTSWQGYDAFLGTDLVTIGSSIVSLSITASNNLTFPLVGVVLDTSIPMTEYGIPSLSFGYTAGAAYRDSPASLILGGYDATGMAVPGPSFNLSENDTMNLTLSNITATNTLDNGTNLLPSPIAVLLDSSADDLYMPTEICDRFVSAFCLISNDSDIASRSFSINGSVHQQLRKLNPLITFTLADPNEPSTSVDICLSYKSLDTVLGNDIGPEENTIFPLHDIGNSPNGSLGRRFFQEMYAIVDYGRGNFSISQSSTNNTSNHIPQIIPISDPSQPTSMALIALGLVAILLLLIATPLLVICATVAIMKQCAKPRKERLKKLDQIWIQIHTIERDREGVVREDRDESEEETRLLTNQG